MARKTVYLETVGCQMNVLDSELVLGQFRALGYEPIDDVRTSDVALFNTCSVRQHAEDKVLSVLGRLKRLKEHHPDRVVGVIGCMAERDPEGIIARMPHVDLLCGPGELNKIPAMVEEVRATRRRAIALSQSQSRKSTALERALQYDSVEALDLSRSVGPETAILQSYVRVQRGCDKFCTFCVVPFTRGPERSRPPSQIVTEAGMLADRGCREVTLLGQTINSYVHTENGRQMRFADLLGRVNDVPGIERVRFVTSYPGDFDDDIFAAMRDLPHVCEYLHLPVQSGSNAVLRRMRRQYSVERYVELIDRARDVVPGITLAGDFIVGFCGETDAEFAETRALVERCRYKNIFVFKYSARPGTVAGKRVPDDVHDSVKRTRNNELLALQERISLGENRTLVGREVEVLVEGPSKSAQKARARGNGDHDDASAEAPAGQLVGRTRTDRIVVFEGPATWAGQFVRVRIAAATALTLHGHTVNCNEHFGPNGFVPINSVGGGARRHVG